MLLLVLPAAGRLRRRRIVHHDPGSNAHTTARIADTNADSEPEPNAHAQSNANAKPDSHTHAGQP